jgi:acetyl-CoA carboxylase/biotin carboxylase 1
LLRNLTGAESPTDYEEEANVIEKLDLTANVTQLKADRLARRLVELTKEDRKATLDGFLRFADGLSDDERAAATSVLQSAPRLPGTLLSYSCNFPPINI